MSEDGEARFREPQTVYEEREIVEKAIPPSEGKAIAIAILPNKFLGRLSLPF